MIILDTNVVSEMMRPEPDSRVIYWISNQPAQRVFLTSITVAELRFGVVILPPGKRRDRIASAVDNMLREEFSGRVLPFDYEAAYIYAEIGAGRRLIGKPISHPDCQIAAIARFHEAVLVTRNVDHFAQCEIALLNPWTQTP